MKNLKPYFTIILSIFISSIGNTKVTKLQQSFAQWTGFNATWTAGAPTTGDIAKIIFGGSNSYIQANSTITLKSLYIDASSFSGNVQLAGANITVNDSIVITGTNAATIQLSGNSLICHGVVVFNASTAANALIDGSTSGSIFEVGGDLIFNSAGKVEMKTGTTFKLSGSGNQTLYVRDGGASGIRTTFGDIEIDKTSGTVSLADNATLGGSSTGTISGNITVTSGTLSSNSKNISLTNSSSISGAGTLQVTSGSTLNIGGSNSLPSTTTLTLASGSTVEYSGASQTVAAADYSNLTISSSNSSCASGVNVKGMLNVTNGATFATSDNVTLISDATQTAGIGDLSNGTVTGNVTCQRYVAAQSVAGNPGWWYMIGSPVNGQTLASLSDDLEMTGFSGSAYPSSTFTSVVTYSPDSANAQSSASYYPKAKSDSDPMTLGKGFYVYIADDGVGNLPKTIDWTGSISENVTVTMDQAGAMSFNLVANPLPCAVSINAGTNGTNVTQSYFQDDAGNFVSGTGTLAMGEGIWFEVSADGATYDFNETDKLTSAEVDQFHKSTKKGTATVVGKELEIIIHRPYGHGDKARIILNDDGNATLNKDPYLDGSKIPNFYGYTNVSFTYGTEEFSLNQIPSNFAGPITFPIRFWRETAFNQNVQLGFEIKGVEDFKANGICLTLEEIATGNMIPLDKDYSTQVNWFDQNNQPLYNLHLTSSFEEAATDASCYGYNDGTVTANLNTTDKYDFYLTNLIGDTLQSEVEYVGNSYTFNNVNAGEYKVVVNDPNGCGMIARPVSIQEPDPVVSFFTTKTNTVDLDFNPSITFNNLSANAQNYFWKFGDGNTSSDESPTHTYQDSGAYKVEMIALNGTCADTSSKSIKVIKLGSDVGLIEVEENPYLKLLQRNEQIEVRFDLPARESVNAQLFNNLGQVVWSSFGNTFQKEQISLELPSANTFYILNIKGETFDTNYKLIRR